MSRKPENPFAFPRSGSNGLHEAPGMSLRDWFAGQALAGALADFENNPTCEDAARRAYHMADAMLSARNAESGK